MKKQTELFVVFCFCIFFLILGNDNVFSQDNDAIITKKDSAVAPVPSAPSPVAATPPKQVPNPESHSLVSMQFIKEKSEQGADSTFFNILKITNTNTHPIQGVVKISVPAGWIIISENAKNVTINPDQTEYVPIRISLARSVTGGTSYIINATLTSGSSLFTDKNQNAVSKSCYITVPQKRKWDMYAVQRTIYFDRYSAYTPLQLKLVNRGNGAEVVKLEFELGSSLEMYGSLGSRHITSIELKPHSDTILSFPIKYFPSDESDMWNRDFKKQTVKITARVDTIVKQTSANFKYLESTYYNLLSGKATPLNIEMQLQNLLSNVDPRMLLAAYGTILLKNDDEINYNLRFNSIPFSGYGSAADGADYLWRRSRMMASYKSSNWEARIGDNLGYGSGFFGIMGRGVGGKYDINSANAVGGAFGAAIGTPIYSGTIFHEAMLPKGITLRSSVNGIMDNFNKINTYGASVQVNYPFLPGHSLSLLLSPSMTQHNYNNQTFIDPIGNYITTTNPGATLLGFGMQLGYRLTLKKVSADLNAQMTTKNFSQYYNGKMNLIGSARYVISKKYYLVANSGLFLQDPQIYNRGILYPKHKYFSGSHKVEIADRVTKKLTLFSGPDLEHLSYSALKINSLTGDSTYTHFNTISPKLSLRASYKNSVSGFINPYTLFGYTFITRAEDSTISFSKPILPNNTFFSVKSGVNIIQKNWGMNVYYYLGPQNLSSQTDYYYFGRYSKSIRIMPFFQKYYFNKTMLLSSYDSYFYEVLSNREHITLNARLQFFLGRDWTFYVDNNLYMSSVISSDGQKNYSRSYFLNLGVKKSFDIPQPRIKYYDLKVICFKDINGNKIQDINEQGLADVVIKFDRESKTDSITKKSIQQVGQFSPAEVVTDNFGQVIYYHIPEGEFNLHVFPLVNLKDLYNINGQTQKIAISRDTTYYIPFVQSYRVIGHIVLNRDEFSSNGIISAANIRITATDSIGNSFPTLTSADGSYILYVPNAGEYKVTVNNIYGEQFILQEPAFTVIFNGAKEFQVDFTFNEKKRLMNIVNANQSPSQSVIGSPVSIGSVNTSSSANPPADNSGVTYRVQIASSPTRLSQAQRAKRFKGAEKIKEYTEGGVYKYTAGDFATFEFDKATDYKEKLRAMGYKDAFVVFFKDNNKRVATPAGIGNTGGVKDTSSSVSPVNIGAPVNAVAPVNEALSYRVQLLSRTSKLTPAQQAKQFKGVDNIQEYTDGGAYKYTAGDFPDYAKAAEYKNKLNAMGFSGVFVVTFKGGKRYYE
ncbi:MAG: SPOR domain-containing protein [Bacteroidetes bacterium]|nr:SPOR domain-containing protein [Bacteroidota bacterium]